MYTRKKKIGVQLSLCPLQELDILVDDKFFFNALNRVLTRMQPHTEKSRTVQANYFF